MALGTPAECTVLTRPQAAAVLLGLVQLALVVVMYVLSGEDAYVSNELQRYMGFNLFLTVCVIMQTLTCDVYLLAWREAAPEAARVGLIASVIALAGWGTLASFDLETGAHMYGLALFMAGQAGLYVSMLTAAADQEPHWLVTAWFVVCFLAVAGQGIGFLVCSMQGMYTLAVIFEWGSFLCMDSVFILFFITHAFAQHEEPKAPLQYAQL